MLVVHMQVQFIEALTNVYVRFNRTRLKGRRGEADCRMALACLFDVLLTVCKARSPLPPCHMQSPQERSCRQALTASCRRPWRPSRRSSAR